MIFGKRVNAIVLGDITGSGQNQQLFPNSTYPTFTVRKFMGIIFQTLRPEMNISRPFGQDPNQLRIVFADWPQGLVDDFPLPISGTLRVGTSPTTGKPLDYPIVGAKYFPGSHMEIYVTVGPNPTGDTGT